MKGNLFQFCGGYQSAAELLTKVDLQSASYVGVLAILKKQTQKYIFYFKP